MNSWVRAKRKRKKAALEKKARARAKKDKRRFGAKKNELPKGIIGGVLLEDGKIAVQKDIVKSLHYTANLDKYDSIWLTIAHNPLKKTLDVRINLKNTNGCGIEATRITKYWVAKAPKYLAKYVQGNKLTEIVSRKRKQIEARL